MANDLKKMTVKQLEKLRADVDKHLAEARARDKKTAIKALEKAAAEHGYSLDELTGSPTKARKPRKAAKNTGKPKYANPADKSQTWTGKGRQPNWYREAVEAGKSPESMAV